MCCVDVSLILFLKLLRVPIVSPDKKYILWGFNIKSSGFTVYIILIFIGQSGYPVKQPGFTVNK